MRQYTIVTVLSVFIFFSCGSSKTLNSGGAEKQNTEAEKQTINFPTLNIEPNQLIRSPQKIILNSQGIWSAFEGEIGTVSLVDEFGGLLSSGILFAEGDWMTDGPAMFSSELKFTPGLANKGKLIIYSNTGGGSEEEALEQMSFEIPVRFK